MDKSTIIKCAIALLLVGNGMLAGLYVRDYYGSLVKSFKTKAIQEAIANGEIIRTSELELKGWNKSRRYVEAR